MAFRGNPRLRGHRETYEYSEAELTEYLKCRADFEYWAEKYAKIATLDDGIVTIKLRGYQKRMIRTIKNLPKQGKRGMVVLAPRQCGKTTGIYLYILWLIIFFEYKRVAIIANKGANARKVIRDIKQAYEFLPLWMQPGVKDGGWSKGSIELENGSMVVSGSTTSDSIRGQTFHCLSGRSEVIVRFANGEVYKTTMRGLNEQDESTFVKLNNVYFGNDRPVSEKQISGLVQPNNAFGLERYDRTPSHNPTKPWWYGCSVKPEAIERKSSFGSTSFIDQNNHGTTFAENAIRLCSNDVGKTGKTCGDGLEIPESSHSSIGRESIETDERSSFDRGMEETDFGIQQGKNFVERNQNQNIGFQERKFEGRSEDERTQAENIGSEYGESPSVCCENEQESREDSQDSGKTSWNETKRKITRIDEPTTERETVSVEGGSWNHIGRDTREDASISNSSSTAFGDLWGQDIEVFTDEGWKRFEGCVNNGFKKTWRLNLSNGLTIGATDNHEFSTYRGWVRLDALQSDDMVDTVHGQSNVASIEYVGEEDVYDLLNVEDIHCFYSNGIKVHNCVYIDEYAFIPKHAADDFMKSVLPTILSGKSAQLFATSTPKGMNQFWRMWRKAEAGKGMLVPVKIDYTEVPNYTKPEFKKMIIETEGLATWRQEFECKFLGSSKTLINAECLEEMALKLLPEPIVRHFDDKFKIWEKPSKGASYILAVDSGKGVGGDYSIVQVLRIYGMHKAEQVAVFADNYTPINDFAQICVSIARYYNNSEIIVENNDLGGVLCERIFEQLGYDRLVSYEKDYFGVRSNKKNKAIGNIALREYIESNWVKLNDEETVKEFSFYEEVRDNVFQAIEGEHDDRVMSLLWALFWLKSNSEFEDEGINQINARFRIHDKELGYEDTGMGDGDADWMGGGGSTGDWLGDSDSRQSASIFGKSATADNLFSGFGGGDDDFFGSMKVGANSPNHNSMRFENGGYRHSNGALAFEDDIPSL